MEKLRSMELIFREEPGKSLQGHMGAGERATITALGRNLSS